MTPVAKRRAEDCFFFSSFFVNALVRDGLLAFGVPEENDDAVQWNAKLQKNVNRLKKWTHHTNIFF
jgi:hypothetical protein